MTDEEILSVAHRTASTYRHRSEPESPSYGFMNHTILDFARRIEQAATAATQERCAKVCIEWADAHAKDTGICTYGNCDFVAAANDCADAIRRGE